MKTQEVNEQMMVKYQKKLDEAKQKLITKVMVEHEAALEKEYKKKVSDVTNVVRARF
jgi:hypothetical protein